MARDMREIDLRLSHRRAAINGRRIIIYKQLTTPRIVFSIYLKKLFFNAKYILF